MKNELPSHEGTYVIDAESAAEMARLTAQDRLLTEEMGGPFPEQPDLGSVQAVLDLACGPGGWALDVAHMYPRMKVTGVDLSHQVIEYAQAQAWSQGIENAQFRIMNILEPLDFPDASFDLVNARAMSWFMPREAWPKLIRECVRVLRPGGLLRFTEGENNFGTTPAFMKLSVLGSQAAKLAGLGFSVDGHQVNVTPVLGHLMRQAGCEEIGRQAYAFDFSYDEPLHRRFYENLMVALKLSAPFLAKMGVATAEELEQLYEEAMSEMHREDFCALWYLLAVWGRKPQS